MFRSAALRLTVWYLAMIMALSVFFSVAIYQISSHDLEHNINRQTSYYSGFLSNFDLNNYSLIRHRQLDQDRDHLRNNLIFINLLVLLLGGAASLFLAQRTLEPIEDNLESQKRFAADASHELRTPLAAMHSEIEVALRDPKLNKTEAVALLGSNLEEVAKLEELSERLLKLATQSVPALSQAVSLKDAAVAASQRLTKAATAKNIKIRQSLKEATVAGDQHSLSDLVAILLDNAIKYSDNGQTVSLSSGRRSRQAFIEVKDNGQGIKPEDLPYIFDRFYRADQSRSKNQTKGYGLGLALAKKITEIHKGHIEVTSTRNKSSTFTVYLPAV